MTSPAGVLVFLAGALVMGGGNAQADGGAVVYQQCSTCHQPHGEGIPGMFPPLRNRLAEIVATAEGREYVITVLTGGLVGTIAIDGQRYVGAMPAQGLTDAQTAEVINYITTVFAGPGAAGSAKEFSEEEVAAIRAGNSGLQAPSALSLRSKVPLLQD